MGRSDPGISICSFSGEGRNFKWKLSITAPLRHRRTCFVRAGLTLPEGTPRGTLQMTQNVCRKSRNLRATSRGKCPQGAGRAALVDLFPTPGGAGFGRHLPAGQEQLGEIFAANILAGARRALVPASPAEILPDAAWPQTSAQSPGPPTSSPPSEQAPASRGSDSGVIALLPPTISLKRLTAKDKFQIYIHQNFGPQNFILPAVGAGFLMLHPPPHYPHDWEDGGGAFGRCGMENRSRRAPRGERVSCWQSLPGMKGPRYVPSGSKNALVRTFHAVAFTFADKTDSGHKTFAFSNFAGAAAGGFVGMVLLPDGYNDATHAEQRALRGLATAAVRNIVTEFRPEWAPILRKIHVPNILPEWWTPRRKSPSSLEREGRGRTGLYCITANFYFFSKKFRMPAPRRIHHRGTERTEKDTLSEAGRDKFDDPLF